MIPLSFKPPFPPLFILISDICIFNVRNKDVVVVVVTNLINQSRLKPLFELILTDLFTCWSFRFVFDPRLYEYQFPVFELSRFAF